MTDSPETTMAAASIAGGAASVIVNRTPSAASRKIAEGVCGALAGIFLGPVIAELCNADGDNKKVGVAFLVACFAVVGLTGLMEYINGTPFKTWLNSWIGGKLPSAPPPMTPASQEKKPESPAAPVPSAPTVTQVNPPLSLPPASNNQTPPV